MTIALSAAVVLLGVLLLLLLGAQVEMYRTVEQLREYSGLVDQPLPLDLPEERIPSRVGLPAALDGTARGAVLLLSDRCGTCRSLAESLDGAVNPDVYLVVEPGPGASGGGELAMMYRLDPDRTLVDLDGSISAGLGVKVTPAAVFIEHGRIARATTVPSTRQLDAILRDIRAGRTRKLRVGTDAA